MAERAFPYFLGSPEVSLPVQPVRAPVPDPPGDEEAQQKNEQGPERGVQVESTQGCGPARGHRNPEAQPKHLSYSSTMSPLLPPRFLTRRIPSTRMCRSADLHIS